MSLAPLLQSCRACSEIDGEQQPAVKTTYRVGLSAEYPPFEFQRNGQIVGLDIDLAHALGRELGATIVIQEMQFSALVPTLRSGRIHMAISGMSRTEQRANNVDFSQVYYQSRLAAVGLKSSASAGQKQLEGNRIGAQLGTVMQRFANGVKGAHVVALEQHPQLLQELKLRRIDVLLCEQAQAAEFVRVDSGLVAWSVGPAPVGEGYAIAFTKHSPLRDPVNQALQRLREKGELDALIHKWLGEGVDSPASSRIGN